MFNILVSAYRLFCLFFCFKIISNFQAGCKGSIVSPLVFTEFSISGSFSLTTVLSVFYSKLKTSVPNFLIVYFLGTLLTFPSLVVTVRQPMSMSYVCAIFHCFWSWCAGTCVHLAQFLRQVQGLHVVVTSFSLRKFLTLSSAFMT